MFATSELLNRTAIRMDQSSQIQNNDGMRQCLTHRFFGRNGGVSKGNYTSLNCGFRSGDDITNVKNNLDIIRSHCTGVNPELIMLRQSHSAAALIVDRPLPSADLLQHMPAADAAVTNRAGIALCIITADCAPILFVDPVKKIIGAAHAGWRGALYGIIPACIAKMEHLGAQASDIHAAIGPMISQENYEIGPEFKEEFLQRDLNNDRYFLSRQGRQLFDLRAFIVKCLEGCNIKQIDHINHCTYKRKDHYFSHRRAQHQNELSCGRMASLILLGNPSG